MSAEKGVVWEGVVSRAPMKLIRLSSGNMILQTRITSTDHPFNFNNEPVAPEKWVDLMTFSKKSLLNELIGGLTCRQR
jgi:hypothetical protein